METVLDDRKKFKKHVKSTKASLCYVPHMLNFVPKSPVDGINVTS